MPDDSQLRHAGRVCSTAATPIKLTGGTQRRKPMTPDSLEIEATFDGEVFRPVKPVRLTPDSRVRLVVHSNEERQPAEELELPGSDCRHHELDRLFGTWSAEDLAEFEAATEWTQQIQPEDWE
jgi:predicted DNA-binding antitoxin AbrB/MazE fold protein